MIEEPLMVANGAAARKQGMDDEMFGELAAIVALANQTNRLAIGYQIEVDPQFRREGGK